MESEDSKEKDENINGILNKAEPARENLRIFNSFPKPYLIRKVLNEKEVLVKSTEDMRIVISELECEWIWNRPMGFEVKSSEFFDYYLDRKVNMALWKKPLNLNKAKFNNDDVNEKAFDINDAVFSKKAVDTNDLIFSKKADENASKEESNLVPIGEEDELENEGGNNQEDMEEDEQINEVSYLSI